MPKALNWAAIKKRYLQGERPKDIAVDYGMTAKQVSDKANKQKWVRKKSKIIEKVEAKVENELEALKLRVLAEYERIAFSDIRKLMNWDGQMVELLPSNYISDDVALSVSEVGRTKDGIKLKVHNKLTALNALAEYTGIKKPAEAPLNPTGEDPLVDAMAVSAEADWAPEAGSDE
jgi:phage terminase small subunit